LSPCQSQRISTSDQPNSTAWLRCTSSRRNRGMPLNTSLANAACSSSASPAAAPSDS
jgi:hypothetical protein